MSEYDYEYEWDSKYCYPNSFVLINSLNIQDADDLKVAEREITSVRIAGIMDKPIRGEFDFTHLKDIHHAIFKDIYDWAGVPRVVDISKGNQFCLSRQIENYAKDIFNKLKTESFLSVTSASDVPARLCYYLSEINALHPFREGNGRAQRVFIDYLSQYAGYEVDFSKVSEKEMIEVSALSFAKEYGAMEAMFNRILFPTTPQEVRVFRSKVR